MLNSSKPCYFCVNKNLVIDYKQADMLGHFISSHKKIAKRKRSGLCAGHQRTIAHAIKRARFMALLPFVPT